MNRIDLHIASIFGLHLPQPVALLFTVAFIIFLFQRDTREQSNVTGALWIPVLWMIIVCSRAVSEWLNIIFGLHVGGASLEEGSPLDACFYFALIAAGICVLNKRQVSLSEIFRNNGWLMAFLLYCLVAIVWSDYPFVASKRWIKVLSVPIMALILLTERDPEEALVRLMKRSAYVLIPLSVLFLKYYPGLGRGWSEWGGTVYRGVAQSKNELGTDCLILGLFFFWHLLQTWRTERSRARREELLLIGGFLYMIWWLLRTCESSTSLLCLLVGALIMLVLGWRFVNKRVIGAYVLLAVVTLVAAELIFGLSAYVIELLHKDPTLTDRTVLWADLLKVKINPILGVGFESFWLGWRLDKLHEGRSWQPNEAHNGYLETYLSLGLIGLFILVGLLFVTFRKVRLGLLTNFQFGRFRLGFLAALVLYNWTEVSFRGAHPMWFVFYIIAMKYPKLRVAPIEPSFGSTKSEEEMELVYSPDEFGIESSLGDFGVGGQRQI